MATDKKKTKGREDHTVKAYSGIRQMLFHNEIAPDQKISYGDLAKRLEMSQTPIIQALKWLEIQGLVRREPNRGYYTEPISLKEVEEIYNMRELIETSLLPETINRVTDEDIEQLLISLEQHKEASKDVYLSRRLSKDMDYHMLLASFSQCQVQQRMLRSLFDLLYLKYRTNILFITFNETVQQDHRSIFEAVARRDLQEAQRCLVGHIRNIKDHVMEGLERSIKEKRKSVI